MSTYLTLRSNRPTSLSVRCLSKYRWRETSEQDVTEARTLPTKQPEPMCQVV